MIGLKAYYDPQNVSYESIYSYCSFSWTIQDVALDISGGSRNVGLGG